MDLKRVDLIPEPELAFEYFSSVFSSLIDKHAPYKNQRIKIILIPGSLLTYLKPFTSETRPGQRLGLLTAHLIGCSSESYVINALAQIGELSPPTMHLLLLPAMVILQNSGRP